MIKCPPYLCIGFAWSQKPQGNNDISDIREKLVFFFYTDTPDIIHRNKNIHNSKTDCTALTVCHASVDLNTITYYSTGSSIKLGMDVERKNTHRILSHTSAQDIQRFKMKNVFRILEQQSKQKSKSNFSFTICCTI